MLAQPAAQQWAAQRAAHRVESQCLGLEVADCEAALEALELRTVALAEEQQWLRRQKSVAGLLEQQVLTPVTPHAPARTVVNGRNLVLCPSSAL